MTKQIQVDLIRELGEMAFASRLKRLNERLMRDVSRIYDDLNLDFEARWFSLFYALYKDSPMTVTALAKALGLTHPAVNQLGKELIAQGLVRSGKDRRDERRRLLSLTARGRGLARKLEPLWNEIREATRELIESTGGELLVLLQRVEQGLDEEDMYDRVMARLQPSAHSVVEILDYRPAYKKHFKLLNETWLNERFTPEEHDEAILSDPNGRIIRKGGAVLFARLGERIVGTCALIRHSGKIFELAKMAVAEKVRSRGIGLRIAEAVIERARALGAETLFLETSPKLVPALNLYQKLGFKKVGQGPLGPTRYRRRTFAMTLELNKEKRSQKRK